MEKKLKADVAITMHLPIVIKQKRKYYLSCCSVLDVHSQGDTEKEAEKNLVEAISLFFISCFERGTLDAVLKECGFSSIPIKETASEKKIPNSDRYIDVPIPLFYNSSKFQECHV